MRLDTPDPTGIADRPTPTRTSMAGHPKISALLRILTATVLFLIVIGSTRTAMSAAVAHGAPTTPTSLATLYITSSAVAELAMLALLAVYLHRRRRSLGDLGIRRTSPWYGWLLAAAVTAGFVWLTVAGALRGRVAWGDFSAFRVYNALTAGIVAGTVEEIFFRGFVISELQWAGCGIFPQIATSAALFAVAHTGWGFLSGAADWRVLLGSTLWTGILGLGYAFTYVSGKRSLMPVMAGHLALDVMIEPWLVLSALTAATTHLH